MIDMSVLSGATTKMDLFQLCNLSQTGLPNLPPCVIAEIYKYLPRIETTLSSEDCVFSFCGMYLFHWGRTGSIVKRYNFSNRTTNDTCMKITGRYDIVFACDDYFVCLDNTYSSYAIINYKTGTLFNLPIHGNYGYRNIKFSYIYENDIKNIYIIFKYKHFRVMLNDDTSNSILDIYENSRLKSGLIVHHNEMNYVGNSSFLRSTCGQFSVSRTDGNDINICNDTGEVIFTLKNIDIGEDIISYNFKDHFFVIKGDIITVYNL
jgi:hypothetical protein